MVRLRATTDRGLQAQGIEIVMPILFREREPGYCVNDARERPAPF